MILVRYVFNLKFGQAKPAVALWKEASEMIVKYGGQKPRILTDLSGRSYVLVIENTYAAYEDIEKEQSNPEMGKAFGEWYAKFMPLVDSSTKELFTVIE